MKHCPAHIWIFHSEILIPANGFQNVIKNATIMISITTSRNPLLLQVLVFDIISCLKPVSRSNDSKGL